MNYIICVAFDKMQYGVCEYTSLSIKNLKLYLIAYWEVKPLLRRKVQCWWFTLDIFSFTNMFKFKILYIHLETDIFQMVFEHSNMSELFKGVKYSKVWNIQLVSHLVWHLMAADVAFSSDESCWWQVATCCCFICRCQHSRIRSVQDYKNRTWILILNV